MGDSIFVLYCILSCFKFPVCMACIVLLLSDIIKNPEKRKSKSDISKVTY